MLINLNISHYTKKNFEVFNNFLKFFNNIFKLSLKIYNMYFKLF